MLTILSPAKALDFSREHHNLEVSRPDFDQDAQKLVAILKKKSVSDLQQMMSLSEDLARLNVLRYEAFASDQNKDHRKPAVLVFNGDTYQGLNAGDFDCEDHSFAQQHLRILSGLYGVLRPLDVIEPYRLEMGTRLKTDRGYSLYDYWGERVAQALEAADVGECVLNCASQEYFRVAGPHLKVPVITPQFKEERDGDLKMISFFAKRARGAMARFVIKNRINSVEEIKEFDLDGYRFNLELSTETVPVFTRPHPNSA